MFILNVSQSLIRYFMLIATCCSGLITAIFVAVAAPGPLIFTEWGLNTCSGPLGALGIVVSGALLSTFLARQRQVLLITVCASIGWLIVSTYFHKHPSFFYVNPFIARKFEYRHEGLIVVADQNCPFVTLPDLVTLRIYREILPRLAWILDEITVAGDDVTPTRLSDNVLRIQLSQYGSKWRSGNVVAVDLQARTMHLID